MRREGGKERETGGRDRGEDGGRGNNALGIVKCVLCVCVCVRACVCVHVCTFCMYIFINGVYTSQIDK